MDEQGTWTDVTSDLGLVHHVLNLYFCWEYPTLTSLSREHFLADFREGRKKFCSPLLVNSLLALGSRFSDRPGLRSSTDDPFTAGDQFFKEAERIFWGLDRHNELTTIQALGAMAIREASCGRDDKSRYYAGQSLRLTLEMGLHRPESHSGTDDEATVRRVTFWGAFALDNVWSLTTGSLPQISRLPSFPPKIEETWELEQKLWIPYTDDGSSLAHPCEQPGHIRGVYNCFCDLSEIVHEALYILYCPVRTPTSKDLLDIYGRYVRWYDNVPEQLRLGHNFTPQVLFVHMYYHFAIVLTFRPFMKLRIKNSPILPRQLCLQAADAIQTHLRSYSNLYTLRRSPSFAPYIILVSSRIFIEADGLTLASPNAPPRNEEPNTAEALRRGIGYLDEMAACHRTAIIGANMLRHLARAWNVYVGLKTSMEAGQPGANRAYEPHWSLRRGERGQELFAPHPGEEEAEGGAGGGQPGLEVDDDALKNANSWPGPRRTPQIVPIGAEMLEEAGFGG